MLLAPQQPTHVAAQRAPARVRACAPAPRPTHCAAHCTAATATAAAAAAAHSTSACACACTSTAAAAAAAAALCTAALCTAARLAALAAHAGELRQPEAVCRALERLGVQLVLHVERARVQVRGQVAEDGEAHLG